MPKPPYRLYDQETADATGIPEAGYFDARIIDGDERAREDGTIATLAEAITIREEIAVLYGCDVDRIEIRDADGVTILKTAIVEIREDGSAVWNTDGARALERAQSTGTGTMLADACAALKARA